MKNEFFIWMMHRALCIKMTKHKDDNINRQNIDHSHTQFSFFSNQKI